MELSEAIAILEKNPEKEFESYGIDRKKVILKVLDNGAVQFTRKEEVIVNIDINWRWQEVKQPVTWKEALHAWVDGKDIHCEMDDSNLTYHYQGKAFSLLDSYNVLPISRKELIFGKWYID